MWLLGGLLFLCLACLEIPEMNSLSDDTSNDFTIVTTGLVASVAVVVVRVSDTEADGPITISAAARESSSASTFLSQRASRDVLALHSLWRT
jgi:hypothetical protein